MSRIRWVVDDTPACVGDIVDVKTGKEECIQSDWDFPSVAGSFGWTLRNVQRSIDFCDHDGTDGTVDCKECGVTVDEFISGAYDWLKDNDGVEADDPGYFPEPE